MNSEKDIKEINDKMINLQEIEEIINSNTKFVILTHHNPDADAIGSSYALAEHLLKKGKLIRAFIPGRYPTNLEFLNIGGIINAFDKSIHHSHLQEADVIFVLDLNAANRLNNIAESFIDSKAKKILIDHHLEPENFCDGYFTDTEITATGVLIYDILKNSDKEYVFSKSQADALYTAIMTDTGSFRFPKTDAQTHRLIAELIDAGAEPFMLYDQVYNQFPISALRIKARAYSKIEIFLDGKFCLTTVTRKDFEETGALEEETEALVESLLSVQGIYFAGLLIESTESEHVRCSFRAKNGYEVRSLAVSFGGGGHAQAAGARIKDKTLVLAKAEIINYVLNNYQ